MVERDMQRYGRFMMRERLQLLWLGGVSVLFMVLFLLALSDVLFHISPLGRWMSLLLVTGLLGVLFGVTSWIKRKKLSPSALAVAIERYFPELDNHLVNFIQLSKQKGTNPLVDAYLKHDAPELGKLDAMRMRDVRKQKICRYGLAVSLAVLLLPLPVLGSGWTAALWRVLNPFSDLGPVTRTRILAVQPGNADVSQGTALALKVDVQGAKGHSISVEIEPSDGRSIRYDLGMLDHPEPTSFVHEVARVNTPLRYRFRAGDSVPSEWFQVTPHALPAVSMLQAVVRPPEYTGQEIQRIDLLEERFPRIAAGSDVILRVGCTVPMKDIAVAVVGNEAIEIKPDAEKQVFEARFRVTAPGILQISGKDMFERALDAAYSYQFVADAHPVIQIVEPGGRVLLPPGENPAIRFRVTDDYGLARVALERVNTAETSAPEIVQTWEVGKQKEFEYAWRGTLEPRSKTLTYRVIATDIAGNEQTSYSEQIVFSMRTAEEHQEVEEKLAQTATDQLQRIIELQQENLASSRQLQASSEAGEDPWKNRSVVQAEIRTLTRSLLRNPVRPLGAMEGTITALYGNEMLLAVDALERIPQIPTPDRSRQVGNAITLQDKILSQLQAASAAAEGALLERRQTAITALLQSMIEGQSSILDRLKEQPSSDMFRRLAQRQDTLSEDLASFQQTAARDSLAVRGSDEAYADLLLVIIEQVGTRKIRDDMLIASDQLEQRRPDGAMEHGQKVHANLSDLLVMLDQVAVPNDPVPPEVIHEALQTAHQKATDVLDAHEKFQQQLDAVRGARDEDTVDFDRFLKEYEELIAESKETLAQIPVDLHVFMDLNVANELVEDVFSVFQEVEQSLKSKEAGAEAAREVAFAKNLTAIEKMREMQGRVHPREMWISESPENTAVMTEVIDREEMPEAGIALGALAGAAEDLISDLFETTEEFDEAGTDSASTHANPDFSATGHDIIEGDITSFGAQGKSGGDAPDDKEQDGRSNVGREGMAVGETASGSGTINEGSDKIEERRTEEPTQSGEVQLEGEAEAKATGGGKVDGTGKAEELGMEGGTRRMDSSEEGSEEGMSALMGDDAEAQGALASLQNVRTESIMSATDRHISQDDERVARGNIGHILERQRQVEAELAEARAQLAMSPTAAIDVNRPVNVLGTAMQVAPDAAPPRFRNQVSDYFRILNEEL
jgi:hypothetical protein